MARTARAGDLRRLAARGTLVNAAFLIGFNVLGFLKGFAVAAFLTVSDYGVWGLLVVSLITLVTLIQVGVDDKYIQQDWPDQKAAFQVAFTLQLALAGVFLVVVAAGMPLYALAFHNWDVLLPGYVLALAIPATALQAPLWTFYREMDFLTQRRLQAFDPLVSFAVTIVLAIAGAGYWSLVIGTVVGAWAAGIAAARKAPYPFAIRYEPGTLREYATFSGPLFLSALTGVVIGFVPVLVAQRALGVAAVGAIALAANITNYANRVDEVVTNTLYPAVCAVADRRDLLQESFLKSNRIALLWAVPFGAGAVLFAPDLVTYVLGERWRGAVLLIQILGLASAVNQIGFNWSAFFRALANTKPIAVGSGVMCAAVLAIATPLLVTDGVDGYAVGMGVAVGCLIVTRLYFLARLFALRPILINVARGFTPVLPAVAATLVLRAVLGSDRHAGQVIAELAAFGLTTLLATIVSERALLREVRGYLRGGPEPGTMPAA